jgi:hypothetical protein
MKTITTAISSPGRGNRVEANVRAMVSTQVQENQGQNSRGNLLDGLGHGGSDPIMVRECFEKGRVDLKA